MANNPFTIDILSGQQGINQGLGNLSNAVGGFMQQQEMKQQQQAAQDRRNEFATGLQNAIGSESYIKDLTGLMTRFPEYAEEARKVYGFTNEQTEQIARQGYLNAYKNPEQATQILNDTVNQISAAGGNPAMTAEDAMSLQGKSPDEIRRELATGMIMIDPKIGNQLLSENKKPAAVLETEWLLQQPKEVQETHRKLKRGERTSTAEKMEYDKAKADLDVKTAQRKAEISQGIKQLGTIAETGRGASKQLNTIKRLQSLNEKAFAGTGAEFGLGVGKAAKALGIDVEGIPESEQFAAISNELVLDKSQQMSGALSNADMDFLRNTAPTLTQSREGRGQMLDYAERLANREREYAKQAQKFRKDNGYFSQSEFQQEFDQWAEENPLFEGEQVTSQEVDQIVISSPIYGDVTEADIQETMRANGLTRDQVLERLQGG